MCAAGRACWAAEGHQEVSTHACVMKRPLTAHSKRVGLDKALFQVEQAVKRAATGEPQRPEDGNVVSRLRELLDQVQAADQLTAPSAHSYQDMDESSGEAEGPEEASNMTSTPDLTQAQEESLAIDDAENPLQLLARASYFQPPEEPRNPQPPPATASAKVRSQPNESKSQEAKELQRYFASAARVNLDVGDDVDPIALGLATAEEGEALFRL